MGSVEKTVYGLVDPRDGRVRYVGSSRNPMKRYRAHLQGSSDGTAVWIRELKAQGFRPDLRLLTDPCEDWATQEMKAIAAHSDLLNRSSSVGGEGKFDTTPAVASYLVQKRVANGLSQSELARRSGLSQAAVSQYEAGKRDPSLESLYKLSEGLGEDFTGTLGGVGEAIRQAKRAMRGEE